MTRLTHYDDFNTARFITFSCYQRFRYLKSAAARNIVVEELTHLRVEREIRLLGWVIMPDHMHLVLWPPRGVRLGTVLGQMKARMALKILRQLPEDLHRQRANGRTAVWQRRCYDHNCRSREIVRVKINYCHMNPVRAGLVSRPDEWPWSSYRWYAGFPDPLIEIDMVDL